MECYVCHHRAAERCSLCGNAYCPGHGGDFCADCLNPINAAPSGTVFRTSVFALLVASVLALWLLVRPPGLPGETPGVAESESFPTPTRSPTPAGTEAPTPTVVPSGSIATPTPATTPEPTPQPTPEPTPAPTQRTYTIQEGDTLWDIATALGVSPEALAAANGLSVDDPILQPGQQLAVP